MKPDKWEKRLLNAVNRLEEARRRIETTQGYRAEMRMLRILKELLKEQVHHEGTVSSARSLR